MGTAYSLYSVGIGHEEKSIQEAGHETLCNQVYIDKASKLYIIRLVLQVKIRDFLSPKITPKQVSHKVPT